MVISLNKYLDFGLTKSQITYILHMEFDEVLLEHSNWTHRVLNTASIPYAINLQSIIDTLKGNGENVDWLLRYNDYFDAAPIDWLASDSLTDIVSVGNYLRLYLSGR